MDLCRVRWDLLSEGMISLGEGLRFLSFLSADTTKVQRLKFLIPQIFLALGIQKKDQVIINACESLVNLFGSSPSERVTRKIFISGG